VIALTHDPKLDDLALMEALRTPAFYGALGSRRNNQARRERLKEFDLTELQLARLHGPVGIYIGSRTPPEIAISILAEVVAAKNHVSLPDILQVEGAKAAREIAAGEAAAQSCPPLRRPAMSPVPSIRPAHRHPAGGRLWPTLRPRPAHATSCSRNCPTAAPWHGAARERWPRRCRAIAVVRPGIPSWRKSCAAVAARC
jgi:hypothetical protein